MPVVKIRYAKDADVDGLGALEAQSFASDRLARRSLQRLISRPTAALRVAAGEPGGSVHGYRLVLFRKGSSVARLYSIAVAGELRGAGLGRRLLADAERVAAADRKGVLRLEVRADNRPAIRLYESLGYRQIGRYAGYYADKTDAIRYEKPLSRAGERPAARKRGA
jgi:ribosomal protein S18 acetylase RimI-like enzyme